MTDNTERDYVRVAEDHLLKELQLDPGVLEHLPATNAKRITLDLPRKAFEIESLLTAKECDALVALAEKTGLQSISWEYDPVRTLCRP